MNRLEKFRQSRNTRRKVAGILLLLFTLVSCGIAVADYSINSIMWNEKQLELFTVNKVDNSYYRISLMNQEVYLNVKYINRDMERLKEFVGGFFD